MGSTRAKGAAKSKRKGTLGSVIVATTAFMAVMAVGGLMYVAGSKEAPKVTPPTAANYSGSIVISLPNRADCRQYQLNNKTGDLKDEGDSDCSKRPSENQGTRVEAISNGFRNR